MLRSVSKTNVVELSTGEVILRSVFNSRITAAKELKWFNFRDEHDHDFCEHIKEDGNMCRKNASNTFLDVSHTIPVPKGISMQQAELAYDQDNLKIRCRKHHLEHDNNGLMNSKEIRI